jgi:hypothetical protein
MSKTELIRINTNPGDQVRDGTFYHFEDVIGKAQDPS